MAKININLLPSQFAPKSSVVKLIKYLKRWVFLGFSLYLLLVIGSIVVFILLSNRMKAQSAQEDELKKSIKALQETEQRLILIQDRLAKAEIILGQSTTKEEVESFDLFVNNLPEEVLFQKAELFSDRYIVALSTNDSENFATLLADLSTNGNFKSVILTSYSYSEENGYGAVFELSL